VGRVIHRTSDGQFLTAEQIDAYSSSWCFCIVGFSPRKISRHLVGRESSLSRSHWNSSSLKFFPRVTRFTSGQMAEMVNPPFKFLVRLRLDFFRWFRDVAIVTHDESFPKPAWPYSSSSRSRADIMYLQRRWNLVYIVLLNQLHATNNSSKY